MKTPRNTGHTQDTLADSKNARLPVYRFDMQFSTTVINDLGGVKMAPGNLELTPS